MYNVPSLTIFDLGPIFLIAFGNLNQKSGDVPFFQFDKLHVRFRPSQRPS